MVSKTDLVEEREEFERVFNRYLRPVSYYFARRGCSKEESQDLAQETFIGFYRGMETYRAEANLETWLFTIAANVWRNRLRGRAAQKRSAVEISLDKTAAKDRGISTHGSQEDDLLADERRELVRQALPKLPSRMRSCLLLRLDQGLKYREIAEVMETSEATVKSQLFQAKERLQKILGRRISGL